LTKICEPQINTPLTTQTNGGAMIVHFSSDENGFGDRENLEIFRGGTAFVLPGAGLAYVCVRGREADGPPESHRED
jgi:hypothetical protein